MAVEKMKLIRKIIIVLVMVLLVRNVTATEPLDKGSIIEQARDSLGFLDGTLRAFMIVGFFIMIGHAGFIFLTSGDKAYKREEAKEILAYLFFALVLYLVYPALLALLLT